jgi:ATP-binding cassette subfamily B protein
MKHIWRIITYTGNLWRYYVLISVFTILLAIMSQLQPLLTKAAIDEMTKLIGDGQASVAFVGLMAFFIFLTDFGQTIFSNIGGHVGDLLMIRLKQQLSERYYQQLLSLPQSYFDRELSGTIINRMSRGIQQIGDFMQMMSNNFLQFIFSTIFALIIVAVYSWQVALMLGVLYPIFMWMTAKTSNRWQKYQTKVNRAFDIASGRFAESISQVKVVKSFIAETRELNFFRHQFGVAVDTTRPQSRFWHQQDVARRVVLNMIFLVVFVYIFVETARGSYTIGEMVLLIQYAALIRLPIFSISFLIDRTQRAIADSKDYFAVMDLQPEIQDQPDALELEVKNGEIGFEGVSFSYDSDQLVLKDMTFNIQPDTKVALVGESGEGKTTLTNLLLRLYEPDLGAITIDGQNINEVTQASLRSQIGVVFQEPALFSGTIRENISYARPDATEAEVVEAARAANADEFISKFEKGYDAEIGERGLKLSGGQKQRIAIARALLKDAPILILDEATSSLDSKSEHMVQEALERLMKGRTTIIIAHRLSTIQHVDMIITLKKGKIDEIGTPADLEKSGGIYDQLLAMQKGKNKKKLQKYDISS